MTQQEHAARLQLRLIEKKDNAVVADIIRLVMTEFKAVGCGFSINDAEVDDMYTAYAPERSAFHGQYRPHRLWHLDGAGTVTMRRGAARGCSTAGAAQPCERRATTTWPICQPSQLRIMALETRPRVVFHPSFAAGPMESADRRSSGRYRETPARRSCRHAWPSSRHADV